MGTGSPGGSTIIQYVVKTVVAALDWGLDAQQATSMIDFGAANSTTTNVGTEHPNVNAANNGANDPLIIGLRAMGHVVPTSNAAVERDLHDHPGSIERRAGAAGRRRPAPRGDCSRRYVHAMTAPVRG